MSYVIQVEDEQGAFLVTRSRTRLLMKEPWFGHLALRLRIREMVNDPVVTTMAVDGTRLFYNPEFVKKLDFKELMFVVAHEIMHCALRHPYRRGSRDARLWNIACDYSINDMLSRVDNITMPKEGLIDPRFQGMNAEHIYAVLADEISKMQMPKQIMVLIQMPNPQKGGGKDKEDGQGGQDQEDQDKKQKADGSDRYGLKDVLDKLPTGRMLDPESIEDKQEKDKEDATGEAPPPSMTESDWESAAVIAERITQEMYGKTPMGLNDAIKQSQIRKPDCWEMLRKFIEKSIPRDYDWAHPNKRFLGRMDANGNPDPLILPGLVRENLPPICIIVDTSGSMFYGSGRAILAQINSHFTEILHEYRPEHMTVIYCDAHVQKVEQFVPDDPRVVIDSGDDLSRQFVGGGGTDMQPAIDYINEEILPMGAPACAICFTDQEMAEPQEPNEYPFMWAIAATARDAGFFGETVRLPHPDELGLSEQDVDHDMFDD